MQCYTERNNNDLSFQYRYLKSNSRTFYKYNYLSVSLENLVLHQENGSFFSILFACLVDRWWNCEEILHVEHSHGVKGLTIIAQGDYAEFREKRFSLNLSRALSAMSHICENAHFTIVQIVERFSGTKFEKEKNLSVWT